MAETKGSPIIAGYVWNQVVAVKTPSAVFPSDATFTAHVRATVDASTTLATLTVGSGITRLSDQSIQLTIAGATSVDWTATSVVLDLVRTDTTPDQHMGWRLKIPVVQPVTRGLS